MVNNWEGCVTDDLLQMLNNWMEYYISVHMKYRALPTESQRFVYHLSKNSKGKQIFTVEIVIGIEEGYSTTPAIHRHNRYDEFTHAFRALKNKEQLAIIGYADPFDELKDRKTWKLFLKDCKCRNDKDYERLIARAMEHLQIEAQKRRLVEIAVNHVRTWECIAELLKVSVPTAKKIVEEGNLPVYRVNGTIQCEKDSFLKEYSRLRISGFWSSKHSKTCQKAYQNVCLES